MRCKKYELNHYSQWTLFQIIKNKELCLRVEETLFLHFQGALLTKRFAELQENLKMNRTKPNHNYIVIK